MSITSSSSDLPEPLPEGWGIEKEISESGPDVLYYNCPKTKQRFLTLADMDRYAKYANKNKGVIYTAFNPQKPINKADEATSSTSKKLKNKVEGASSSSSEKPKRKLDEVSSSPHPTRSNSKMPDETMVDVDDDESEFPIDAVKAEDVPPPPADFKPLPPMHSIRLVVNECDVDDDDDDEEYIVTARGGGTRRRKSLARRRKAPMRGTPKSKSRKL